VEIGKRAIELSAPGGTTSIDHITADVRPDADGGEWWCDLLGDAITLESNLLNDGKGIRLRLLLRCGQVLEGTVTSERDWREFVFRGCPNMEDVVVSDPGPSEPSWEERYQEITQFGVRR
jgi:hypothetical protein